MEERKQTKNHETLVILPELRQMWSPLDASREDILAVLMNVGSLALVPPLTEYQQQLRSHFINNFTPTEIKKLTRSIAIHYKAVRNTEARFLWP